jgi:glycolate oxidase iron-sulfur subunit
MQTNFSDQQLADPRLSEADRILRRCVHCGLCMAVCSTYVILGDERDSPRGRIYLIKDMLEKGGTPSDKVRHHVDRCLSCLSCMTTCPSGVDYMHLVDIARAEIEDKGTRSFKDRLMRRLLAFVVPHPRRFRLALRAAALGRPLLPLMRRLGFKELAAMLDLAPLLLPAAAKYDGPGTATTKAERRARVILLAGCAQQVLRPSINDATVRLLARRGVDVVIANGAGCCGALVQHLGQEQAARAYARANVIAWAKELAKGPIDAIIINASGCGTTVKDYGHMLRHDPEYAGHAAQISRLTKDIAEFVYDFKIGAPSRWSSIRVAYHSACSMQHGQGITDQPMALLKQAGYSVVDVPEGHICCGSAGTYNMLQPELAGQLRDRKVKNIRTTKPDVVATGNIGCITQLEAGMDIPVGLEHLDQFVSDVPQPKRVVEDFIDA